ncbi:MAG TPA: GAF domain-containing sensor histidine kinase [Patescibacteria group bacterium]
MQLRYVLLGISIFSIITFAFGVILPLFDIKPVVAFDAQSSLIWVALTAYSIVAHQLFDIRVIIKKTVVYSGLLLFTLAIYSTIIFIFTSVFGGQDALNPTLLFENILAATLIAIGFEPIRRYLTNVTDKYLFKGDYDPQSVLAQLSQKLSGSLDIKEATQSLVTLVKTEMRLSHAAVVTFGEEESKIIVKQATQDGYLNPGILLLPPENLFLQHFAHSPETIVTDILKSMCEGGENSNPNLQLCHILLVDLEKLSIAVAIPIKVNDKAVGMFLVGEKLSGDAYTKNEIEFLQIVANQTANAIQKARFWEEDQLKSEFVSIASHELLTPTAAMKGYLSMILDDGMGEIDETARKYLTKVFQSSERLAHLVEDLLNVSRIESGRLKINKKEFSLVESVQKATEELSVNAKNKSLDLAFVAAPQALANVYADPDHIYRVLINLIGNSIKYTSQGWVRCFVTQQDTQHLLFTVCDSGLGIPQENLPHLFEKFYRADRKEIAGIQGTGLGLYISKKIIDLMGGQMWVESQVGKGTTFYFTLPIAGTEVAKQSEANTPHEVSALNTTGSTPVQQPAPAASAVVPSPTLHAKTN